MQGMVFTALSDMVIEKFGMDCWNTILQQAELSSEGIFTSGQQYPDGELLQLVGIISNQLNIPVPDLVKAFGVYLFPVLYARKPKQLQNVNGVIEFLTYVENTIHYEVKRLYPDTYLPTFEHELLPDGRLKLIYRSKRKMCTLAEGLVEGAAAQFNQHVRIEHPVCIHRGAEHCEFFIEVTDKA
ncbi:MAG: heme NO-binding domain-containing protein [Gammaproteobacteria bacterium]|nr:heme NO-binding domain-containing protein [Gammaproteobacteria bacterium]MBU2224385.1 heme NO-binding domain-containing protein [Gammaproteobacteria bacterium]MBU2429038.1 heme NO-binding domain-containing protein [Gammaproteobacteria bacterium]